MKIVKEVKAIAPDDKRPTVGSKRQMVEEYLTKVYDFRYNEITGKPEFRLNLTNVDYKAINDYDLNTFAREMDAANIPNISTALIKEVLSSSYVSIVNPIKNYFEELPLYKGNVDHIAKLAATVTVENDFSGDYSFAALLRKWLVATVAGAVADSIINHTCLVLCSEKGGVYKTTWLNQLVPKSLDDYSYCNKIDTENKDTQTLLAECFIINIDDQIHKLNRKDEDALKNLITAPYVKYRRPYDKFINKYYRLASFCASINGKEFLQDHATSRRFLPFQVKEINIEAAKKIDMDKIYSQCLHLYKTGFQYWFDSTEVDKLYERNAEFKITSIEEQMINEYLELPEHGSLSTEFVQLGILKNWLQTIGGVKRDLSERKLGEALKKSGFKREQKTHNKITMWGYSVIKKSKV